MSEPSARVVADSISPAGHRLTTFEVVMHRFVLAEFNTHRVFSRNSASSRAIPLAKQLERVATDPAVPVSWPSEQKGMQGGDEVEETYAAKHQWLDAARQAIVHAGDLGFDIGVHKSIANRLLEPFMFHTVVVTATAWGNFFGLRCNPMAQPEIRVAAEAMYDMYMTSVPRSIDGAIEWHLPYIDDEDVEAAREYLRADGLPSAGLYTERDLRRTLVQMSSARCARVSYLTQDGKRSPLDDIALYNRLISADPMHASPLEHVATPRSDNRQRVDVYPSFTTTGSEEPLHLLLPRYGNLLGWHSHRMDIEAARGYQSFA